MRISDWSSDVCSSDLSWWLMSSRESNLAKLILIAAGQPDWQGDLPLMAQGLLGMQRAGAWRTTTANLMGSLAIEKFARHYEGTPVAGHTRLQTSSGIHDFDWSRAQSRAGVRTLDFLQPWASKNADRKTVVWGKSWSVRENLGGRREL